MTDKFIEGFDNVQLPLQIWQSEKKAKAIIIGLHGMNDYSECFYLFGPYMAKHGITTIAYDARGFGRNSGPNSNRGEWFGAENMIGDLQSVAAKAKLMYSGKKIFIIGESMGAATILAALGRENKLECDGIILCAPAVWGWSNLPLFYKMGLWLGAKALKNKPLSAPKIVLNRIIPSDNNEMLRKNGHDSHMIWQTKPKTLKGLVDLMEIGFWAAGHIKPNETPKILALFGEKDQIVPKSASQKFKRKIARYAKIINYKDGYHMLLRDLGREKVFADIIEFIGGDDKQ